MIIYGVALLAICTLAGVIMGDMLGVLLGVVEDDAVLEGVARGTSQHAPARVSQQGTSSSLPSELTCTQPLSSPAIASTLG